MNENIQIAIISAGLATLITCIFQFGDKVFSYIKERHENNDQKREDFNKKKEKVYIGALGRLLQIRRGFNYTKNDLYRDKHLMEKVDRDNEIFAEISPQLRLYSTDKIFNMFQELVVYARFAYASQNGPRLFEESKWAYDFRITLLARLMQEDLGYRVYDSNHDLIVCPNCGREHDFISKCPKCGLTFSELKKKAQEDLEHNQYNDNIENDSE